MKNVSNESETYISGNENFFYDHKLNRKTIVFIFTSCKRYGFIRIYLFSGALTSWTVIQLISELVTSFHNVIIN